MTVNAFENEDYLLFAGYQDNGEAIDYDQCEKMFMLDASEIKETDGTPDYDKLNTYLEARKAGLLDFISQRNSQFFDEEITKLDNGRKIGKIALKLN